MGGLLRGLFSFFFLSPSFFSQGFPFGVPFIHLLLFFLFWLAYAFRRSRWDQGLLDMCVGEKRTLTIPPEYGYGQRGVGPIPGGATLIFETELVGIEGVSKDEL